MKRKITRVACIVLTLLTVVASLALADTFVPMTRENVRFIRVEDVPAVFAKPTTGLRIIEDELNVMVGQKFLPTCLIKYTGKKANQVVGGVYSKIESIGTSDTDYTVVDLLTGENVFKALQPGLAYAYLESGTGENPFSDYVTVHVFAKPQSVTLTETALTLTAGQSQSLTATVLPADAFQNVTWTTSNKAVATVTTSGVVTARKAGKAKITVKTANGKKATVTVTVTKAAASDAKYRALSVGTGFLGFGDSSAKQKKYAGISTEGDKFYYAADAKEFANMLRLNRFGGAPVSVKQAFSFSTRKAALAAITSAFKGATENDVSYLYLMANAVAAGDSAFSLFLSADRKPVTAADLRATLDKIKGTKVVILSASFSGDAVGKGALSAWSKGFTQSFSGPVSKSGELAGEGYKVICACNAAQENQIQVAQDFRTAWSLAGSVVSRGAGWNYQDQFAARAGVTDMKADTNGDGQVTLSELYNYAAPEIRRLSQEWKKELTVPVEMAVWPADDDFVVFARN